MAFSICDVGDAKICLSKSPSRVSATVSQKVSTRRVLPCSFTGESPLQSLQQRLTEVSFEDASQASRVSDKSVSGVCPARVSYKSLQEWLAEVSFEGSPREVVKEFHKSKSNICFVARLLRLPVCTLRSGSVCALWCFYLLRASKFALACLYFAVRVPLLCEIGRTRMCLHSGW